MAMIVTALVFGQNDNIVYPIDQPEQDSPNRTGWVGGTDSYNYYFILQEGQKYAMRLPAAGELPAGDDLTITQVGFRWQSSADGNNFDPHFRILIYAGGNGDWIQPGQSVSKTMDTTVQGTLLYSQDYEAQEYGWQLVKLNRAVAIPENMEIWIAVQALGRSCCHVCPDFEKSHPEWWGQHLIFGYSEDPVGYYWRTAAFKRAEEERVPGRFALMALVDNGEDYVNTVDWDVDMYSLETAEEQKNITYLYVDPFMMQDKLYLAPALWNLGPDDNSFDGLVQLYVDNPRIYFVNKNLSEIKSNYREIGPGFGWVFDDFGALMEFSAMERYGLTFPFYVCMTYESYGRDPNPSNNQACVKISDKETDEPEDPNDGISEKSNTLVISPNPASTYIKVKNAAGSQISVYSIAGQEVLSVASAEANETLNVGNLAAGLYTVRVVKGNEVSIAKVSIVR